MHFRRATNSDCQTRLLNVIGQIAMFWETKKFYYFSIEQGMKPCPLLKVTLPGRQ